MGGALGWSPRDVRDASLAELWACWIGHGKAAGWFRADAPAPMTRARLHELMERFPDV
jgi:hypothetical protein